MDAAFRRVADASPAEIIDVDTGASEREGVRSRLEKASSSDPPPDPDPSNIDLELPQLRLLRRDWVNGELSSKELLEYVRAGKAQGAGGYDDLAAKGGKALTNAARDVMKFVGMPKGCPEFSWYQVTTVRGTDYHPFLCPHPLRARGPAPGPGLGPRALGRGAGRSAREEEIVK